MRQPDKILICPLDWGLGHATRCIPLIEHLTGRGAEVWVAGNSITNQLLQQEFPSLNYIHLKGYEVKYSKSRWALPFKLLAQLPRLLRVIRNEHQWLKQTIVEHQFDAVISDNRYGLYSDRALCVFMTHQLQIAAPQSRFLEQIINSFNRRLIRRFNTLWIPDYPDHSMAGSLSTPTGKLPPVKYLGNLSRFEFKEKPQFSFDLLFLLSGPEPQRTLLEKMILEQCRFLNLKILLVRGKPGAEDLPKVSTNIQIVNYLGRHALQEALTGAKIILCRSGYSTIMDLLKLRRHAVLVATPGQTEQEYLADLLAKKKWFITVGQTGFQLEKILKEYEENRFADIPFQDHNQCKIILDEFLTAIQKAQ